MPDTLTLAARVEEIVAVRLSQNVITYSDAATFRALLAHIDALTAPTLAELEAEYERGYRNGWERAREGCAALHP
jgi:hypothetical protein